MREIVMHQSLAATEWKPMDSSGNRMVSQRAMGFVGVVPELQFLPLSTLQRCTFSGALNEAVRHDGREDQDIATACHMSSGYFSKFMRAVGQAWARRLVTFMRETRSLAPLQWIAEQMGCDVVVRSSVAAELAEAKALVADLERRLA